MTALEYFVVDVFTDTPLAGNPLAVVMNTAALTTEKMQAIAREFNLSETTFVERRARAVERAEGVRVRIFTTREELPFAGHPTLGTASVLRLHAADCMQGDTVRLALNVGPVPVRFEGEGSFAEMTQPDPEFGCELDPVEVAELIGLSPEDLDPALRPQIVSTGTPFAIVVLHASLGVGALARLRVKQEEATAWLRARGARWFYVLAPALDPRAPGASQVPDYRARMQFNGGEDPATGSAAGCAISYLVQKGSVAPGKRILVRQGVEIGRPSDLFLRAGLTSARVGQVRVAGSTVSVANGRLFLP
jgi:trans-2,3-dihydro-3-hydroxyanthranilate isomerase